MVRVAVAPEGGARPITSTERPPTRKMGSSCAAAWSSICRRTASFFRPLLRLEYCGRPRARCRCMRSSTTGFEARLGRERRPTFRPTAVLSGQSRHSRARRMAA